MNEILVANMALAAYLVSSAERTSITTMRSWLRLKEVVCADGCLTYCSPAQAYGGLSSSSSTASASLSWSRLREVSARRNLH